MRVKLPVVASKITTVLFEGFEDYHEDPRSPLHFAFQRLSSRERIHCQHGHFDVDNAKSFDA